MKSLKRVYKKYRTILYSVLGILGLFFVWWLISYLVKTSLFPGPESVIPHLFTLLATGDTYLAIGGTLLRLLIAVALGVVFGFIFGVIAYLSKGFRAFNRPFIVVLRTIPTAAVIFIIIALLKPIFAPTIIVFLITYPIMYEAFLNGLLSVNKDVIEASKIDGASLFKSVLFISLPLSKSYILLGLVSSLGLGMKVSIMSEILAGSRSLPGLGNIIYNYSTIVDMEGILAVSLIAIILIGISDIAIYLAKSKLKKGAPKK